MSSLNIDNSQPSGRKVDSPADFPQNQSRNEKPAMSNQQAYSPFSYGNQNQGTFGQRIQPNEGSAIFAKVTEVMNKALVANKAESMYDIVALPREIHKTLSFSVLVVVRNNKVPLADSLPLQNFVVGQAFIVASTGTVPARYQDNSSFRRPVVVTPTVEDANNSLLVKYITDVLRDKYGSQNLDVMLLDPVVIPAEVNITDESYINKLLSSSATAVETRAQSKVPGFQDFNFVAAMGGSDLEMPVSVDPTPDTQVDLTNRPIYGDAVVSVAVESAQVRGNHTQVMNSNNDSRPVCQTLVMTDLVPCEVDLLEDNRALRNMKFDPRVAWAPRLTARNIDQYLTRTGSGTMFAIASIAELARNRDWAQTFRTTRGTRNGGENYRDVGYLNIEANLKNEEGNYGSPIDTSLGVFSDADLGDLLDCTVAKNPILAVDCYTTGPNAYQTTALALAARGNRDVKEAANRGLMHSMNCATNGILGQLIDLETPVVEGRGDLIHVGYWFDGDKKRDIAELDTYLAFATIGGIKNPKLAQEWMATYFSDDDEEVRMANRLQLLESAATGSMTLTGTALRVTINADVIAAFVEAMARGKLPLVARGGEGDLFTTRRPVSNLASRSVYRGDGFGRHTERRSGSGASSRYAPTRY